MSKVIKKTPSIHVMHLLAETRRHAESVRLYSYEQIRFPVSHFDLISPHGQISTRLARTDLAARRDYVILQGQPVTGPLHAPQTILSVNQRTQTTKQKGLRIVLTTSNSAAHHSDSYSTVHFHQRPEEAMFDLQRQKVLDECKWTPGVGRLRYIEARTFANTGKLTEHNLRITLFLSVH